MRGFITERHLGVAEHCFPGIRALFRAMPDKPRTFLDLLRAYWCMGRQDDSGGALDIGLDIGLDIAGAETSGQSSGSGLAG